MVSEYIGKHKRQSWTYHTCPESMMWNINTNIFLFYKYIRAHMPFFFILSFTNICFVCELSSNVSVNCLHFCRWTVSKLRVGELCCRWTVSEPHLQMVWKLFLDIVLHISMIWLKPSHCSDLSNLQRKSGKVNRKQNLLYQYFLIRYYLKKVYGQYPSRTKFLLLIFV